MSDPLLLAFEKERLPTISHAEYWRQPISSTGGNHTVVQYEDWMKGKLLGGGAYGTVRLVQSAQDKRRVRAVKGIFKMNTPTTLAIRELHAMIELKGHPEHFVEFFGWWEDHECFYLAMEYIEQGDLMSLLRRERLTEMDARIIARQILEGLRIMHKNHICHRDIKPENILTVSSPSQPLRVKLADFGCAKLTLGTKLRTNIGTDGYMAPEVLGYTDDHDTSEYNFKADQWSLGCLIFFVLARKLPLVGYPSHMKYITGQIALPSEELVKNGVGTSGIDFISMLMAPDRNQRPSADKALLHSWLVTEEPKQYAEIAPTSATQATFAGRVGDQLRSCAEIWQLMHNRLIFVFGGSRTTISSLEQGVRLDLTPPVVRIIRSTKPGRSRGKPKKHSRIVLSETDSSSQALRWNSNYSKGHKGRVKNFNLDRVKPWARLWTSLIHSRFGVVLQDNFIFRITSTFVSIFHSWIGPPRKALGQSTTSLLAHASPSEKQDRPFQAQFQSRGAPPPSLINRQLPFHSYGGLRFSQQGFVPGSSLARGRFGMAIGSARLDPPRENLFRYSPRISDVVFRREMV